MWIVDGVLLTTIAEVFYSDVAIMKTSRSEPSILVNSLLSILFNLGSQ